MTKFQRAHYNHSRIQTRDREKLLGQKAVLIWFTALSGSGKSTLANVLELALDTDGYKAFMLASDGVHKGVNRNLGFSKADRMENTQRVGKIALLFLKAGVLTIACFICLSAFNPEKVGNDVCMEQFVEVISKTQLQICEERKPKSLFKKARNAEKLEFTGISATYDVPNNPDIVIDTTRESIPQLKERLMEALKPRIQA
ncbi:MAG: adenylyl-sulfate kinase [Flavobacteriales bacterium]|nr:adenylyl-sulfate kinase [Flavobacteriales bacterium]